MPNKSNFPVLIIDDEAQYLQGAAIVLRVAGFEVTTITDPLHALDTIRNRTFAAILLDILMPGARGDELLDSIIAAAPHSAVIMTTAVNDIATAVKCIRKGAFDYLLKPVEKDRLVTTVRQAVAMAELRIENKQLKEGILRNQLKNAEIFEPVVTRDPQMLSIFRYIEAIAASPMPVLVKGETGTGKELVAQAIHQASSRNGEFVCVNAAGMTDILLNDALFGHEKGAFTGADSKRPGLVAKAAGGTLFLDEIGDMTPESQIKVLRLLEERTYYPTGSDTPRTSDTRIIAATNQDLDLMRREGKFRNDLYYRLEAHIVEIPPLRQRRNDIPLLIDYFAEKIAQKLNKEPPLIARDFYTACSLYSYPGNVRELRNIISDIISIFDGTTLTTGILPARITHGVPATVPLFSAEFNEETLKQWHTLPAIRETEHLLINEALRRSNGNQTIAAQLLGMTRSALNKRLTRAKQERE